MMYAQLDEHNVCHTVSTVETDIPAAEENLGQKYEKGVWLDVEPTPQPHEPTNSELAQAISDLQADLIIAGVI